MTSLSVNSYAKLNLALDVLDKRPDGYHDIESVVQQISLHDTLTISKRDDTAITLCCTNPAVPAGEGNLACRAAVLFLEAAGLEAGVDIAIEKNIPMQAGLGGGSSNAAAALSGLNRLLAEPLGHRDLLGLAAKLGSDVPLFLAGGSVFMSGRGEILSELPDLPLDFIVIKPDFGISTPWAYQQLDSRERQRVCASREVADAIRQGDPVSSVLRREKRAPKHRFEAAVAAMHNDFESVAESAFPEITAIRARLMAVGADRAMLAGSGSAIFGVFADSDACDTAFDVLRSEYTKVFRAQTVLREESASELICR